MLLLARHGETDDNVPPYRFQGQRDTPLNERGRAQARELAERVAALDPPIASLWCSDLSRARETAEIVGARIGLEPREDPRLREGWRGEWEGFLFDEIAAREPERYAAWRGPDSEIGFRFPGGESLAEQQARVLAALADVRATGELPALVVCHGGSIRTVLCASDPRGLAAFHAFEVPNVALVPVAQAVPR
ncbi:MAG TPA: histidine phosphatase family protein [Conexibacter sp.]|nr:histidine phosphatase family protein [Conexibacter sp.]